MYENVRVIAPRVLGLNHKVVDLPQHGMRLACSVVSAFRLSTGELIKPEEWISTVSDVGGKDCIPDSMALLQNSEVVLIGSIPGVEKDRRDARISCGSLNMSYTIHPDPEDLGSPFVPGYESASWNSHANPEGRGGPDDPRKPLIVGKEGPASPTWLAPTPFAHPARLRRAGVPQEGHSIGSSWADDSDPTALNEAHPDLWLEDGLFPGARIELVGLSNRRILSQIPPYRVVISSVWSYKWAVERARIHSLMLIPESDLGAAIWRAPIRLRKGDWTYQDIVYLIAGMEDVKEREEKKIEDWYRIAFRRTNEMAASMDDRPLLPRTLARIVPAPFAFLKEKTAVDERLEGAQAWVNDKFPNPTSEDSPFAGKGRQFGEMQELEKQEHLQNMEVDEDEGPLATEKVTDAVDAIFEQKIERRKAAGIDTPDPDVRKATFRGADALDAEAEDRLSGPFRSQTERSLLEHLDLSQYTDAAPDPKTLIRDMAEARIQSPVAMYRFDNFERPEAEEFGDHVATRLRDVGNGDEDPLERYVDISDAVVLGDRQPEESQREGVALFSGLFLDALLSEGTYWEGVEFSKVKFFECSLTESKFKNCSFKDCEFIKCELSYTEFHKSQFEGCIFRQCLAQNVLWGFLKFSECQFESIEMLETGGGRVEFESCKFRDFSWIESIMLGVRFADCELDDVTLLETMLAEARFERVKMFKVWGVGRGLPHALFEDVDARTCGFTATFRFDDAQFVRCKFRKTGFANAYFIRVRVSSDCIFDECDFSGASFMMAEVSGVAFPKASMFASNWVYVRAVRTSFYGAVLTGSVFDKTKLHFAIFVEAGLEGVELDPGMTVGADFTGALRAA